MATRSDEIKKVKASIPGHSFGNAVNVSPFSTNPGETLPDWTVHVECRKCHRGVYIDKRGDNIKSWGNAKQSACC